MAKRFKRVVRTYQVAHIWAAHNRGETDQSDARSSSVTFSGTRLYSYSQEIARFDRAPDGTLFVWFNDRTYSPTTSKHQHRARNAISGGHWENGRWQEWPYQPRTICLDDYRHAGKPREAIDHLLITAQEHADKAARMRDHDAAYRDYAVVPRLEAARWLGEKYNIPLGTLQMELHRMEKRREGERLWSDLGRGIGDYFKARDSLWTNIAEAMRDIDKGLAWLEGRKDGIGGRYDTYSLPTMLRLKADGVTVETSRYAEFPLAHGLRVLPLIKACRATGRTWERGADLNHPQRLGHFQLDRVDAEGNVKAGCHYVPWFAIDYLVNHLPQGAAYDNA